MLIPVSQVIKAIESNPKYLDGKEMSWEFGRIEKVYVGRPYPGYEQFFIVSTGIHHAVSPHTLVDIGDDEAITLRIRIAELENAIEEARKALSQHTHGGAQYMPDILEANSMLAKALDD